MAQYVADEKCIASVYPGQLPDQRRSYGPTRESIGPKAQRSTLFHMPSVPRGGKNKFAVIKCYDSFEEGLDVMAQNGLGKNEQRPRIQRPVPVESIIDDLMTAWTGNMFNVPAGARPGVMPIVGTVPTQDEMAQMREQQALYFEFWFAQGEALARGDKQVVDDYKRHSTEMRLAADWLGRDRPWSNARVAVESGPCPFCTTIISNMAIICPACHQQLRETPAHLALFNQPEATAPRT